MTLCRLYVLGGVGLGGVFRCVGVEHELRGDEVLSVDSLEPEFLVDVLLLPIEFLFSVVEMEALLSLLELTAELLADEFLSTSVILAVFFAFAVDDVGCDCGLDCDKPLPYPVLKSLYI